MLSVEKNRMIRFYKNADNQSAIVTQFNGKIRVFDGETELFFTELTNAIKHLLDDGYCIEYLFNTTFKYPEENRI
jgi:hypothetical protein